MSKQELIIESLRMSRDNNLDTIERLKEEIFKLRNDKSVNKSDETLDFYEK